MIGENEFDEEVVNKLVVRILEIEEAKLHMKSPRLIDEEILAMVRREIK